MARLEASRRAFRMVRTCGEANGSDTVMGLRIVIEEDRKLCLAAR